MKTQTIKGNIFQEYPFIKQNIVEDLEHIASTASRLIKQGTEELANLCFSSWKTNSGYFEESFNNLYFDLKNVFNNYKNKKTNSEENWSVEIYHPQIIEMDVAKKKRDNSKFEEGKFVNEYETVCSKNYTSCIDEIIEKSDKTIREAAEVMAGKKYNSCSLRDKKERKMKNWEDRINYLQGLFKDNKLSDYEKEQVKELKDALQKNKYLKYKKKDYFKKLNNVLEELM